MTEKKTYIVVPAYNESEVIGLVLDELHKQNYRNIIVVDDGVATGRTACAALISLRAAYPKAKLVFAAPVGSSDSVSRIHKHADEVICLSVPSDFSAVGEWYGYFPQLTDAEVIEYLEKVRHT